jgi:hypothetical protein
MTTFWEPSMRSSREAKGPPEALIETVPALKQANRANAPIDTFDQATREDIIATHLNASGRAAVDALNWNRER